MNWSNKQTQFWEQGYVVLENLFPDSVIKEWHDFVNYHSPLLNVEGINHIHKKFDKPNLEARDAAGEYKFTSIDGRKCFEFQGVREYYVCMTNFLSLFSGLDIVPSWDKQSAVTFMNYTAPGGQIVPHYDTNGFTLLIYLTSNEDEGATMLYPLTSLRPTLLGEPDEIIGKPVFIYPKVGTAVFFQGRRCWHQSLPVFKNDKISSVWNYYEKNDNWRPADVSKRLYS